MIRWFFSHKAIVCLIFSVILNIILIVALIVLGVKPHGQQTHGSVSPTSHPVPCCSYPVPCPSLWVWYEGICFYFSSEERNQTSSQDFCALYNASLATIENEEKAFVMKFKPQVPFWIGLTRRSGQPWTWPNGQKASLEVLGEGDNCAYLSDEAEAKASVSRCGTEHRWICSRSSNPTGT